MYGETVWVRAAVLPLIASLAACNRTAAPPATAATPTAPEVGVARPVLLPPLDSNEERFEPAWVAATGHFAHGQLEPGLAVLNDYLSEHPWDQLARLNLASVLRQACREDAALEVLTAGMRDESTDAVLWLSGASTHAKLAEQGPNYSCTLTTVSASPSRGELADEEWVRQQRTDELKWARTASSLSPAEPRALRALAEALTHNEQRASAAAVYAQLIKLSPEDSTLYFEFAALSDDDERATQALRDGLAHNPTHAAAWSRLATRLGANGDTEGAGDASDRAEYYGLVPSYFGDTYSPALLVSLRLLHGADTDAGLYRGAPAWCASEGGRKWRGGAAGRVRLVAPAQLARGEGV